MNRDEADDEEDNVAVEKISSWYLFVHVHDKVITVSCGDANQRVKWLAHVGIGKLAAPAQLAHSLISDQHPSAAQWDDKDNQGWKRLGIPTAVHLYQKDGDEVDMNRKIHEMLSNGDHVYVDTSLSPTLTR